jgi:2-polyprenyl-6-methoxyphenol hydroxylase-like FAD-dependent oxidoreductase
MRTIAIIGSGITGLAAAHGLVRAGFTVDLYSDRTPAQWLNESRPTGTAARFELALSWERELGLNFWDGIAPEGEGVYLTFCPKLHNQLIRLVGRFRSPFQAVDVRLQSARWMEELERRGGRIHIEPVSVERLNEIAAQHDLTLVATGRADLCRLFERDAERSIYSAPQRQLAMIIATNAPRTFTGAPLVPVRFLFLGTDGEIFIVPYLHKDHGRSWNIVVEAKAGSRLDRFRNIKDGEEALATLKQTVAELFPFESEFVRDLKLADPNGWLTGSVTPTVRRASAQLENGAVVAALGDTAVSFDPIAAQGANSGIKQARHLVESIVKRGDEPFDHTWIDDTFDAYWNEFGRPAYTFSNLLLEPITAPAKELLIAQYGSDGRADNASSQQRVANAFVENFNDPRMLTPAFNDMLAARKVIGELAGPWAWNGIRGRARIAGNQLAQLFAR